MDAFYFSVEGKIHKISYAGLWATKSWIYEE